MDRGRSTGAGGEQRQCGAGPGERQLSALLRAAGILPVVLPQLLRGLPGGRPALQSDQDPSLLRDLNVPPSLYPPFVDGLIATVRQYDPAFTPEVEEAWRRTVDKGVKYMIARYDAAG